MKTSLIILSKVGGGAGGFGALIIVAIVFFYLWVKDDNGDLGCLSILFLPLLLPYIYGKLVYKGYEKLSSFEPEGKSFDSPPSLLLKVLVALSTICLWILLLSLIITFDDSIWSYFIWILFLPVLFFYLYLLWKKLFFVWLGRFRPKVAIIICIVSILLVIAFTIAAIKLHNYYTSLDFLKQYWAKKYGLTT